MFNVFLCFIIAGLFLNYLSKKYALYEVHYRREISSKHVEIGEEIHISVIIENRKLLPVTFLKVTEKFPSAMEYKYEADLENSSDSIYHTAAVMILPYQRIKRDYVVKFNQRGKYLLRDVTLTAGDLIGLDTSNKQIEFNEEIVVFPKPMNYFNDGAKSGDYIGDIPVKRNIIDDPLVTAGIREYTGFEPEKAIHWPSSLKTGKLMVRNYDYTVDNSVFIILNIECSKPFWAGINKESIEKCYSLSRELADEFEKNHIKYGFTTNAQIGDYFNGENYLRPSLGGEHYYNILDSLGRGDYSITVSFEDLIKNVLSAHISCRTYIIITPIVIESYIEYINELRNKSDDTLLFSSKSDYTDMVNDSIKKYILEG